MASKGYEFSYDYLGRVETTSSWHTSRRTAFAALSVFCVSLFMLGALVQQRSNTWQVSASGNATVDNSSDTIYSPLHDILDGHASLSAEQYMRYIAGPVLRVDEPEYSVYGAIPWYLPDSGDNATWREPVGEELCIIDLDNRKFNKPSQIWHNETMSWASGHVHGLSLGILNHWLYAKIHGYKYYYINIEEFEDGRRASWKKPMIMSKILRKHKTCVYIDSDAVFPHLDLPFEWLMNFWSLDPETNSLALAYDPDLKKNKDEFNNTYLNTGFIIAQNNPRTFEIFDDWRLCPDEGGRHPNCTRFRKNYAGGVTDQGGFGTYIRYDYPDDIIGLRCGQANGFPMSDTECQGHFIQHLWTGKDKWIKMVVGQQMPGDLLEVFHRRFVEEKPEFWRPEQVLLPIDLD